MCSAEIIVVAAHGDSATAAKIVSRPNSIHEMTYKGSNGRDSPIGFVAYFRVYSGLLYFIENGVST
jgi:hypothetical protein